MDSDSSSSEVVHPAVLLDLIPCPKCGDQISSWVAKRGNRAGSRFYKCRRHSLGQCSFFEWQPVYALRLIEVGIALPQPPPAADLQPPSANITPGQNHIPVVHDEMQSAALPPIRKPEPVTELPAAPFGRAAVQLQVVNLLLAVTNLMVLVLLLAAVIATLLKLYSLIKFLGNHIKFSIVCCQYFFSPAILDDGWVLYMWDMASRTIHVLDPLSSPQGPNPERKESLLFVSLRLHDALFDCLNEFFAGWPKQKENWGTIFPKIVDTKFTRVESGLSILHMLCYYDGERLKFPITKNNLGKTKLAVLHEIMKLQDNQSPLPYDMLWDVLAPSQFSFGDFLTDGQI